MECSFCGTKESISGYKTQNGSAFICDKCLINASHSLLDSVLDIGYTKLQAFDYFQDIKLNKEYSKTFNQSVKRVNEYAAEKFNKDKIKSLKPKIIKNEIDKYVIGQEEAKRILSVAAYNHYKRLGNNLKEDLDIEIEKSNILILGPTGTGKTLLIRTLSKALDVPMAITDATALTENGYVGEDVESVIENLYIAAGKDIDRAETGIVYIDEIDKIAADFESSRKDVGGAGVQQALLKIIEGHKINFIPKENKKDVNAKSVTIDTSNILFIVGGAFADIDYDDVNTESLKDYGIIPEMLGRLPIITKTKHLTVSDMVKILTEPKNSIIKQYAHLFKIDDVDLAFTDSAIRVLAEKATAVNIGARGLRSIIEKIMLDVAYEAPSHNNLKEIIIDYDRGEITRSFVKKEAKISAASF